MKVKYFVNDGFLITKPQVFIEPEDSLQWQEWHARNFAASQLKAARRAGGKVTAMAKYKWSIMFKPGRLAASGVLKITGG